MPDEKKPAECSDESLVAAAERAQLAYVSDSEPGIRRKGAPKHFWYVGPKGNKLKEGTTVQRIRALAIPPAWTEVWISPDANGHIQATGRDQKGRKQYRYHQDWASERDGEKYSSMIEFAEALPRLRVQIDDDLRRHGLPFERVVASVVWLLDNTMIRVGNAAYARDNKSFGLTTLRDRHVDITGARLRFSFKGKSGKEWKLKLVDRRIARVVRGAQDIPGQKLFQYIDEDGGRRPAGVVGGGRASSSPFPRLRVQQRSPPFSGPCRLTLKITIGLGDSSTSFMIAVAAPQLLELRQISEPGSRHVWLPSA